MTSRVKENIDEFYKAIKANDEEAAKLPALALFCDFLLAVERIADAQERIAIATEKMSDQYRIVEG